MAVLVAVVVMVTLGLVAGDQQFVEAPTYREVNPGGEVVLPCVVSNKVNRETSRYFFSDTNIFNVLKIYCGFLMSQKYIVDF